MYYAVVGDNTKGIDTLANVHINKINPIYVWQAAKMPTLEAKLLCMLC